MIVPIYKLTINDDDETGVDYNAFVDTPAHLKPFYAFGKSVAYEFKEEQRIVTGVMMSANTLIDRNDPAIGYHQVFFDVPTIKKIVLKFFKNQFGNNVNKMHEPNDIVKGATMIESFFIDSTRGVEAPNEFKDQNLQDGTWIASYKVENDTLWSEVKSGKFRGFSVEGIFDRMKVNIKTNKKQEMSKTKKKTFREYFMGEEATPEKVDATFAEVTTVDGVVLSYEGDLNIGTPLFITDEEGTQLPAPEGDHQVTLEDGTTVVISVDANGVVADIQNVEADPEAMMKEEILSEVAEVMQSAFAKVLNDLAEIKAENAELKTKFAALSTEKASKFQADHKEAGKAKVTYKDLLKKN